MKKIVFLFAFLSLTLFANAQKDLLAGQPGTAVLSQRLDSAMRPHFYITPKNASKILGCPAVLKDSMYKYSGGILRFTFNYIAKRIDSTSKGRIFFSFEQYKDTQIAIGTYQSIKAENEKAGTLQALTGYGDEGFLQKDEKQQPFAVIRENNKIFKVRLYSNTSEKSQKRLMKVVKKIVKKY